MAPFILLALAITAPSEGRLVPSVVGVVSNPDGSPAPGVDVLASGGAWSPYDPPTLLGRTATNDRGEFRLELADDPTSTDHPILWAYRPGSLIARRSIGAGGSDASIRLTLGPPGDARIMVLDPGGKPLADARIIPLAVGDGVVPAALGALTATTTGADGCVTLPAFLAEEVRGVDILAPGLKFQRRRFRDAEGWADDDARHVRLLPTGKVSGQVVANAPDAASGLLVRVTTVVDDHVESVVGVAETTTDATGRFALDGVAAGKVTVRVRPRTGSPDLPGRVARKVLKAGQDAEFTIPLRRGVRVFGFVREKNGARPVEGAVLSVLPAGLFEPEPVQTDAEGRYETFVPPGAVTHRVLSVPVPYLSDPSFAIPRPVVVPAGIAGFELPPIALTPGKLVHGTVVAADGQPVAGADVEASWTWSDGRSRTPRSAWATSRNDGSFAVGPVDPASELRLSASSGAGAARPVMVRATDPGPTRLTLAANTADSLTGRVVDADGRPVPGASVRVWSEVRSEGSPTRWVATRADAEGQYRTPGLPIDGREYHAVAVAEGFRPARSRPIRPGQPGDVSLPDLVMTRTSREVVLEGRTIDRLGKPISGVDVWTWGEGPCCQKATTDESGVFRLVDVAAGPGFLFAEREGYRFAGRTIHAGPGRTDADLVLTRSDETPETVMNTRPANPGDRALARMAIAPLVKAIGGLGDAAIRIRVLEAFARVDPARALAMIDDDKIKDPWIIDHLRCVAASGLIGSDPERASVAIARIRDPETRMVGDLAACTSLPESARDLRVEWLDRASADANAIRDTASRVVALARVATHCLDLGDPDRAFRILREARPQTEGLPGVARGARARGVFAECLARIDPNEALKIVEGLVDPVASDHHRLRIARVLAATRDSAGAEAIVGKIRDSRSLAANIPALCHAIAPSDPDRARDWIARVVRGGDPCLSPFSLGVMALAVSATDKTSASTWLREAFAQLEVAAKPGEVGVAPAHDPAVVAASLLPVAERIDPGLVPEFFWKAIAIRGPRPSGSGGSDAALIPLLARYHGAAAKVLFEPLAARTRSRTGDDPCPCVTAAAALDPIRALDLIATLPNSSDPMARQPWREASLALATSLCGGPNASARDDAACLLRFWAGPPRDVD